MKKICAILLLLFYSYLCFSQDIWNEDEAFYNNRTYLFHWQLPKEFSWHRTEPVEKSTVFLAKSDYGMMVFVSVHPLTPGADTDMWQNFKKWKEIYEYGWKVTEERLGGKIIPMEIRECRFGGSNAIKTASQFLYSDDVYDESSYALAYDFIKDNARWSVSLKVIKEVYDQCEDKSFKQIFKGFGLNAKILGNSQKEEFIKE